MGLSYGVIVAFGCPLEEDELPWGDWWLDIHGFKDFDHPDFDERFKMKQDFLKTQYSIPVEIINYGTDFTQSFVSVVGVDKKEIYYDEPYNLEQLGAKTYNTTNTSKFKNFIKTYFNLDVNPSWYILPYYSR